MIKIQIKRQLSILSFILIVSIFTVCWSPCMCLELATHLFEAVLPAPTGQEYNMDDALVVLEQLYFRFERAFPVFVRLLFLLPLLSPVLYPLVFGAPDRLISTD